MLTDYILDAIPCVDVADDMIDEEYVSKIYIFKCSR